MDSLQRLSGSWSELSNDKQLLYLVLGIPLFLYLTWRLWRFTIAPALNPKEPPPLPYAVPFAMFRDQEALMEYGRNYFQSRPFTLTIVGKILYIQTNLADINATYKAPADVSFDDSVREIFQNWGVSADGSSKMWRPNYDGAGYPNPHGKSFGQLSHDIQRSQLEAPENLKALTETFQRRLEPLLEPGTIPKGCTVQSASGSGDKGEVKVDLMKLCWQTLIPAGTETFFGDTLRAQRVDLDERFVEFDTDAWKLLMQLPPSMAKRCYDGRAAVLGAMETYLDLPADKKPDSSTMIREMQAEMTAAGMQTKDQAIIVFLLYWLINVNSYKLSFWMLSYVLFDETVRMAVLTELKGNVPTPDSPVNMQTLLNESPVLNALFDEAQRIHVSTASTRNILADTTLNGWKYRKGAKIIIPYRQLHFDQSVFGATVEGFDHTRFLQLKGLNRNAHFKPFGGGNTLCTGRFIARREVLLFIAMILSRWDFTLANIQKFPDMEMGKPGLGVMEPKEGQGVIARMTPKLK